MSLLAHILVSLCTLVFSSSALTDEITAALRQGKASELVKHFDQKVSIRILNQEDVLGKAQAEANLKYFFEKHPVKSLSAVHVSEMNNNAQYITSTLETSNGRFRVSALIRRNLISQFRIENESE